MATDAFHELSHALTPPSALTSVTSLPGQNGLAPAAAPETLLPASSLESSKGNSQALRRDDPRGSGRKIPRKKSSKSASVSGGNPFKDFCQSLDDYLGEQKSLGSQGSGIGLSKGASSDFKHCLDEYLEEVNSNSGDKPLESVKDTGMNRTKDGHEEVVADFPPKPLHGHASETNLEVKKPVLDSIKTNVPVGSKHVKGYSLDFDNPNAPQWRGWESSSPTVIDFVKVSPGNPLLPKTPDEVQYRARRRLSRRLSLEVQKDLPPVIRRTHSAPVNNGEFPSSRASPAAQNIVDHDGEPDLMEDLDPEIAPEPPQWTGGGLPPWLASSNANAESATAPTTSPTLTEAGASPLDPAQNGSGTILPSSTPSIIDFAKLSLSADPSGNNFENGVQPPSGANASGKWIARRRLSRRLSLEVTKEADSEMQPEASDLRRSASAPTGPYFQPTQEELDEIDMNSYPDSFKYPQESSNQSVPEDSESLPRMSIGRRLSSSPRVPTPPVYDYSEPSDSDYYSAYSKPEPGSNAGGWRGAAQWGGTMGGKTTVIDFTDSHVDPSDYYPENLSEYDEYSSEEDNLDDVSNWIRAKPSVKTGRRSMDVWLKASTVNPNLWERQEVSVFADTQSNSTFNNTEKPKSGYSLNTSNDSEKRISDGFSNYNLSINNSIKCTASSRFPDVPISKSSHFSCNYTSNYTATDYSGNASAFPDYSSPYQASMQTSAFRKPPMVSAFPDY